MTQRNVTLDMNQDQVRAIFKYIDATQPASVKDSIFSQLGHECFHSSRMVGWIESYQGDVQAFLDWVNDKQGSRFWERLEYTADGAALVLTGRVVQGCACAFAACPEPPLSLCHVCCKHFQQELFGKLLGRKVEVTITEAYLLGGERCSTIIRLS